MRTIDADVLFIDLDDMMAVSPTGYIHGDTVADMISDAPTVDAIPVEWMRQFKNAPVTDESAKRCDECGGDFVEWMILEWEERKENEMCQLR